MIQFPCCIVFAVAVALLASSHRAEAQSERDCSAYEQAVGIDPASTQALASITVIPDRLLQVPETAIPCLTRSLQSLRGEINSPNFTDATRAKFLRATGALRAIFANNASPAALPRVIEIFRDNDNREVVTVLTYGVRGPDYNSRLNALLILGNVIDNTTVCVPIDHLYDKALEENSEAAKKGVANLLGVVSVVATFAYKENLNAIANVREYWLDKAAKIGRDKDLEGSLQNIKVRLASEKNPNRNSSPSKNLSGCLSYKPLWATADTWMKER